jgi:hypothetical protein
MGAALIKQGRAGPRRHFLVMSALPPKADIQTKSRDVRFVPKADILRCKKIVVIR